MAAARPDSPSPAAIAPGSTLRATLGKDPTSGTIDALFAIHNLLRGKRTPLAATASAQAGLVKSARSATRLRQSGAMARTSGVSGW